MSNDVGTRTSYPLTEARTVLSRAETAIFWLERDDRHAADPDLDAILAALRTTVEALDPFRRTGRPKK